MNTSLINRAAIIDIGSSAIKLIIAERNGKQLKVLDSLKQIIDVSGKTFFRGRISQSTINKTIAVLQDYRLVIEQYDVDATQVIATTAVREAVNKDMYLDTVRRKTGYDIEVLNAADVSYFLSIYFMQNFKRQYDFAKKTMLMVEFGAGSLDLSLIHQGLILMHVAIPLGTLRLKQFKSRLQSYSLDATYEALRDYVYDEVISIKHSFDDIKIDDVIVIDESYSHTLKDVMQLNDAGVFFQIKKDDVMNFAKVMTEGNLNDLINRLGLETDIADAVDGYSIVLENIFEFTKKQHFYILQASLSEAIMSNLIFCIDQKEPFTKQTQVLSSVEYICRKFQVDISHAKHVYQLSDKLFDKLMDVLGLNESDRIYLMVASYLHNIGTFISNRAHHKHTEYITRAFKFFRITDLELDIIACVARYHRKATPQKSHILYNSLNSDNRILVQKLSSILRIANALNASHQQKVKDLDVKIHKDQVLITVIVRAGFILEVVNFEVKKELFETLSGLNLNLKVKAMDDI